MKKVTCLFLAVILAIAIPCAAFADETSLEGVVTSTFIGDDGYENEYIQYSEPVSYAYDGTTHTLLGIVRRKNNGTGVTRDYHEYTSWTVVDNGIVSSWVFMSNPYFVKSVARGETYEETFEKTVTVATKAGINIPSGSQSAVNKALKGSFSLGLTGSYSKKITIVLRGPDEETNCNTRTFYYRLGYHKHNITIIEEVHSNWDGIISRTEYNNCYGYEPAVQSYSKDEVV